MNIDSIIEKELEECVGYEVNKRLVAFTNSLLIYQANVNALKMWYNKMNNPHVALSIWEPNNYVLMEQVNLEMQRLFSNFLSSAYSLRDHLYTIRNEYYVGTEVERDMEHYIEKYFKKNNITSFVQDFRNYVIHCGYPRVSKKLSFGDGDISNDILFDKKALMKFKSWKAPSKKFIEEMGDSIKLIDVVNEYNDILEKYYNEIIQTLKMYHYEELLELKEIKDKYKLALHMVSI